jgi:anti-sigma factor RsiW
MNPNPPPAPVTEAELQAHVDGRLTAQRQTEVEAWLAQRPEEAARVDAYRSQTLALRSLFEPTLHEAVPPRLWRAARGRATWTTQRLAAGLAIALISGATGWGLRMAVSEQDAATRLAGTVPVAGRPTAMAAFAQRAAVAHAVYVPDQRRPVEVDAAHEDELVAWLSKRMGAPMKPPHLQALGYSLEGGRLLPGGRGPVAQFMYRDVAGGRLTLYVSNEVADLSAPGKNSDSAFRFAEQGPIQVFYWVDGPFGYAISADANAQSLTRVSTEVYRQLTTSAGGR